MVHRTSISKEQNNLNETMDSGTQIQDSKQEFNHTDTSSLENAAQEALVCTPRSNTQKPQDMNQALATQQVIDEMVHQTALVATMPISTEAQNNTQNELIFEPTQNNPPTNKFSMPTDTLLGGDAVQLDVDNMAIVSQQSFENDNCVNTESNLLKPPLQSKVIRLPKIKMDTSKVSPI
ncbi:hypothetical protein THRCLA_23306 [Thraustotheca clavata]|uniref:Uncharacterized protein n=1 Tax=Thraustotheca clavata TaxID=74557 RepID=A0A1V9Y7N7_9STRA|nr:hypothetical protein THRCLA_23306 [Thraustotheca clavata]